MLDKEFDHYHFVITKQEIDNFEFSNILGILYEIHKDPLIYFDKVLISIYGYEKDSRELYEIEEVKRYLNFLDRSFPFLFYYGRKDIPRNANIFSLMIMSTCKYNKLDSGMIEIENDSLIEFLLAHYYYLNKLMIELQYSRTEIDNVIQKIDKIVYG
jgi:hypothetical protein